VDREGVASTARDGAARRGRADHVLALLVYLVFRLGDLAIRGQFAGAFAGSLGRAFAAEILLGGVLPLLLLARRSLRQRPACSVSRPSLRSSAWRTTA